MKCETAYLQNLVELQKFIAILKAENVTSYLEIGSKFGGSLWRIANALPTGSRIVAVDLPHGDTSFKESQAPLEECARALRNRGYDIQVIIGDSTSADVVNHVRTLSPFDACFIDANHTVPYVRKDWANYGPMCRLVAFHDIGWIARPQPGKKPIEVPIVWNEIKHNYRHEEIRMDKRDNGIGVLWRE